MRSAQAAQSQRRLAAAVGAWQSAGADHKAV